MDHDLHLIRSHCSFFHIVFFFQDDVFVVLFQLYCVAVLSQLLFTISIIFLRWHVLNNIPDQKYRTAYLHTTFTGKSVNWHKINFPKFTVEDYGRIIYKTFLNINLIVLRM